MINLPTEVLHLVFHLLVQRDKLECMTVCRQWQHIIHQHCLFSLIRIDNQQQLNKLITRVSKDRVLGTKVEKLILQLKLDPKYDAKIFTRLFPNLRSFIREQGGGKLIQPKRNHPWCEHIEKMTEDECEKFTKPLLRSGLCKNLVYISVQGSQRQLSARDFIEALANAPALRILQLYSYSMSFQDLELLHKTVPLLNSLALKYIKFTDESMPPDIKPAVLINSFQCISYDCEFFGTRNPHLLYISKKYTHLEELNIELEPLGHIFFNNDDGIVEEEEDATLVSRHRAILASYLKTLGTRLKSLSLRLEDFNGDNCAAGFSFDLLDECGCQIKQLKIHESITADELEMLAETNQVHHIQSLWMECLVNSTTPVILPTWFKPFTALKELSMRSIYISSMHRHELNLTDLMSLLSTNQLETLRLRDMHMLFRNSSRVQVCPFISELTISCVTSPPGTDILLSRAFPNLKRLKWESDFKNIETLSFPYNDLSYLEIVSLSVSNVFSILVITRDENQPRLYTTTTKKCPFEYDKDYEETDIFKLPCVTSEPFERSLQTPQLTVICKSLNSFVMVAGKRENV